MEIDQIIVLKEALQRKILAEVIAFEEQTRLHVHSVNLYSSRVIGSMVSRTQAVDVAVGLP